jgi:hypothetical protein
MIIWYIKALLSVLWNVYALQVMYFDVIQLIYSKCMYYEKLFLKTLLLIQKHLNNHQVNS